MQTEKSPSSSPIPALLFFTVCYAIAFIGYLGVSRGVPVWYDSLIKPTWAAPDWSFSPVWIAIYGLSAWAGWTAWKSNSELRVVSVTMLGSQLVLTALWCWMFFGMQKPIASLAEIAALVLIELGTAAVVLKVTRVGFALFPVLLWSAYLAMLNLTVMHSNR